MRQASGGLIKDRASDRALKPHVKRSLNSRGSPWQTAEHRFGGTLAHRSSRRAPEFALRLTSIIAVAALSSALAELPPGLFQKALDGP
jgi:hypothetical protein